MVASDVVCLRLGRGMVVLVDQADYPKVAGFNWHAEQGHSTWYARTDHTLMHRLITGASDKQLVDHHNGFGLDNRRDNLRVCTKSQNGANRKKQVGNTSSQYKGVTWHVGKGCWLAQLVLDKKCYRLGYHLTEEKAARAYDRKAIEVWGEFARLNFPSFQQEASA